MPVFQLCTIIAFHNPKINPADWTAGLKFSLPAGLFFIIFYKNQIAALAEILVHAVSALNFKRRISAVAAGHHMNDLHSSSLLRLFYDAAYV